MDELLKEVMGDSYKEGLTKDDLNSFFKGQFEHSGEYVALNKYTDLETKYKAEKAKQATMQTEINNYKNQNLTEQEKLQQKLDEITANNAMLNKSVNKAKVESILAKGGLIEDDYKDILDDLVSEDLSKSEKLANSWVKTIKTKSDASARDALANGLRGAGELPKGGTETQTVTKEQFDKMGYMARLEVKQNNPELYKKYVGGN